MQTLGADGERRHDGGGGLNICRTKHHRGGCAVRVLRVGAVHDGHGERVIGLHNAGKHIPTEGHFSAAVAVEVLLEWKYGIDATIGYEVVQQTRSLSAILAKGGNIPVVKGGRL